MFSDIFSRVLFFLGLIIWVCIATRFIANRRATVKTVKAEICDKYVSERVSRYPGTSGMKEYIVVFKTNNGKLSFCVSEYSYNSYRIKEKGTLKYKGDRLISF